MRFTVWSFWKRNSADIKVPVVNEYEKNIPNGPELCSQPNFLKIAWFLFILEEKYNII
jgi:hypothetical protein